MLPAAISDPDRVFRIYYQEGDRWDEYATSFEVNQDADSIEAAAELMQREAELFLPAGVSYVYRIFKLSLIEERRGWAPSDKI